MKCLGGFEGTQVRAITNCRTHYVEYLCALVFRNNVDPVSVLDIGELKQVFTRANHFMPKQRPGEYEFRYKRRLAEVSILLTSRAS